MKIFKYIITLFVFSLSINLLASNSQVIDSLRLAYKNSSLSEEKLDLLVQLCDKTKYSDFETSLIYGRKGIEIAQKINDKGSEAKIRNKLGLAYANQSEYKKSAIEYELAKELFEVVGDEDMQGVVYNNLGLLSHYKNDYAQELKYYHKALEIYQKLNSPSRKAMIYVNMGRVYIGKKDYKTAASYFEKAYKNYDELKDYPRVVTCLNNIAALYSMSKDYEMSRMYFDKNLELLESIEGYDDRKAMVLYNSSTVLIQLKDYQLAEERLNKALLIVEKEGSKDGLAICYHDFGILYLHQEKYKQAESSFIKSLKISKEIKHLELEIENYKYLSRLYDETNEYEKAYHNYKRYASIKDSIFDKQIEKINEVEQKYLEEKSAREIEAINVEKQKEIHQSNIIKLVGGASILVLVLVVFLVVIKYRDKKKSNLLLAEKNKEITDSIQYAKRIQKAILPPNKLFERSLPNSFILYKPKDIVAGDFYWMEAPSSSLEGGGQTPLPSGAAEGGLVLFAAADCTGHGVPGAMVSVICNNGLNRSVREYGLTDPGKILDKTREIVIQEFEKSEEEVKDGMDIALCSLSVNSNQSTLLQYAGAHNPLWIIRKEADEVEEIKANKQPIGKFDNPEPYITHTLELQKGDTIYVFSDGYADQFGGEKGKKLKTANFKKLLLSIQNETMDKQKQLLEDAFEKWKGDIEQLDDVCVIGVRV